MRHRKYIYLGVIAVVIGLGVWAGLAFKENDTDAQAQSKAQQLHSRLEAAGLATPDVSELASTFGTNGGIACTDPDNALIKSDYETALTNGAGTGPGARPVIGDADMAKATGLVIATYCPDNLGQWLKHIEDNYSLQKRSTE